MSFDFIAYNSLLTCSVLSPSTAPSSGKLPLALFSQFTWYKNVFHSLPGLKVSSHFCSGKQLFYRWSSQIHPPCYSKGSWCPSPTHSAHVVGPDHPSPPSLRDVQCPRLLFDPTEMIDAFISFNLKWMCIFPSRKQFNALFIQHVNGFIFYSLPSNAFRTDP